MLGYGRGVPCGRPARSFLLAGAVVLAAAAAAAAGDYADELVLRARELKLSQDRGWQVLGHWRRTLAGGQKSHAEGPDFFLSPSGKTDPAAELEATLRAFFKPSPEGPRAQRAQCRFPARYAWLKSRLSFDSSRLPEASCSRFEIWRQAIDAGGVTMVFADAFLNNPASMYGHTFLKLRRKDAASGEDLLDYTINFAGTPDTDNPLFYALKGIYGAFPGRYSTEPYYMKVQEYNNLESRDLWEYDLNLDSAQVDQLLRHAWEMGSAYFPYYFFDENCSYQLLTLLDGADPGLRLSDGFGLWVIPADTVRAALSRPGLAAAGRYRPSHVTEMLARRSRLTAAELGLATRLGRDAEGGAAAGLAAFPKDRQALILDSAHDYLLYRAGFYAEQSAQTLKAEHFLLTERSRLAQPPMPADIPRPRPLEEGHDTARVEVGFGASKRSSFEEVGFRPGLHDLPAADAGYIPDSQLEMGDLRLRFDDQARELYVEKLDLVNIVSLSPWDPWVRKPSWNVSTGIDQAKELGCSGADCMYYDLNAGGGLAAATHLWRRELFYALAEADFGAGPVLPQGWRLGGGGTLGAKLDLAEAWRVLAEVSYLGYPQSPARERLRLVQSLRLARDWELRLTLDRLVPYEEAGASLYLYF